MPLQNVHFKPGSLNVQKSLENTSAGILMGVLGLGQKGKLEGARLKDTAKKPEHEILTFEVTDKEADIIKLLRETLKIEKVEKLDYDSPCYSFYLMANALAKSMGQPAPYPRRKELSPAIEFDFLYEGENLIAIFPKTTEVKATLTYLSFAPYYTDIVTYKEIIDNLEGHRRFVQNFSEGADIWKKYDLSILKYTGEDLSIGFNNLRANNSAYLEFDPKLFKLNRIPTSKIDRFEINNLKDLTEIPFIFPNFATVYSPLGENVEQDWGYYKCIPIERENAGEAWLVGPGTAAFELILLNRALYASDSNPFALANFIATARHLGIPFKEAAIADNVINTEGQPVFPKQKFGALYWNMPFLSHGTKLLYAAMATEKKPFGDLKFDNDTGPIIMRLAKGLPIVLDDNGKALLWNFARSVYYKEKIEDLTRLIFQSEGNIVFEEPNVLSTTLSPDITVEKIYSKQYIITKKPQISFSLKILREINRTIRQFDF